MLLRKKWIIVLSLILFALVLAACGGDESKTKEDAAEENDVASLEDMPEPDLEDIPDVVAEVNGEEISKEEFETNYQGQFQEAAMQAQMTGEEVDQDQLKEQTVENLIGQKLLVQGADNGDFDSPQKEIDKILDELVEQNGLESKDELFTALEEQDVSEEEVMSQLALQVKVDQFIASETDVSEPTDEELEEFYDQIVAQQEQMEDDSEEEIPTFDELKSDLVEHVKSQKEAEEVQTLITKLREDADVTIHL